MQHTDLADDALLQRAQRGDQDAFETLVERYRPLLLPMVSRLLRDEDLAQDVLQYVFLKLYSSLPTLRAKGTLNRWLCQVARHRCIDELRRKRPIRFSEMASSFGEGELPSLSMLLDPGELPEQQAERHELQQQLLEAIERLPSRLRRVVWLRYRAQLSFREIGQALGIPEATAKTYFYRAGKLLRTLLEQEFTRDRGPEQRMRVVL